eukprot:751038-Hanusia_phi.AAC.9
MLCDTHMGSMDCEDVAQTQPMKLIITSTLMRMDTTLIGGKQNYGTRSPCGTVTKVHVACQWKPHLRSIEIYFAGETANGPIAQSIMFRMDITHMLVVETNSTVTCSGLGRPKSCKMLNLKGKFPANRAIEG